MTEAVRIYLKSLINKVYKILPLKEEDSATIYQYLGGLAVEMQGCYDLHHELTESPQFMAALCVVQYLATEQYDVQTCRREVFKAINNISYLVEKG